ncbi:MAG: hypothetical protein LBR79_05680, partial [Oscillospiraceae bacterium]|nr:hypothetical protein [Oscillospiraceae bacterium]
GIHDSFRSCCRKVCWFKSGLGHQSLDFFMGSGSNLLIIAFPPPRHRRGGKEWISTILRHKIPAKFPALAED